jgi:hypothetical protein
VNLWRDYLAIAVAAVATAGLAAAVIIPAVYPEREALGYLPGTILSYEFRVTKLGTQGLFDVRLDRGDELALTVGSMAAELFPGDRVCIRAMQRGDLVQGYIVPMDRCSVP